MCPSPRCELLPGRTGLPRATRAMAPGPAARPRPHRRPASSLSIAPGSCARYDRVRLLMTVRIADTIALLISENSPGQLTAIAHDRRKPKIVPPHTLTTPATPPHSNLCGPSVAYTCRSRPASGQETHHRVQNAASAATRQSMQPPPEAAPNNGGSLSSNKSVTRRDAAGRRGHAPTSDRREPGMRSSTGGLRALCGR
jgi:hypothetical protein